MSRRTLVLSWLLLSPVCAEARQVCAAVVNGEAARYCRGCSSDEIIHLRDVRWQQIAVRLPMIPGEVATASERLGGLAKERDEKLARHSFLRGQRQGLERFLTVLAESSTGLREIRESLSALRAFPERTFPELLSALRAFLIEREELLDQEIARRLDQLERAPPAQRPGLELGLGALLELKVLRREYAGRAEELIRRPLSRDSLESDFSPFARALFAAALDADVANRRTLGTLQVVEAATGRLLDQVNLELETQRTAAQALDGQVLAASRELDDASRRHQEAERRLAALHEEKDNLLRERDGIPGRIEHLRWMHSTGCDQANTQTVCREVPDQPEHDDFRCKRCRILSLFQ